MQVNLNSSHINIEGNPSSKKNTNIKIAVIAVALGAISSVGISLGLLALTGNPFLAIPIGIGCAAGIAIAVIIFQSVLLTQRELNKQNSQTKVENPQEPQEIQKPQTKKMDYESELENFVQRGGAKPVFEAAKAQKKEIVIFESRFNPLDYRVCILNDRCGTCREDPTISITSDNRILVREGMKYSIIYPENTPLLNILTDIKFRTYGNYHQDEFRFELTKDHIYTS